MLASRNGVYRCLMGEFEQSRQRERREKGGREKLVEERRKRREKAEERRRKPEVREKKNRERRRRIESFTVSHDGANVGDHRSSPPATTFTTMVRAPPEVTAIIVGASDLPPQAQAVRIESAPLFLAQQATHLHMSRPHVPFRSAFRPR
ncbi:unnamed protein product [Microthlaspi erraticum]|uniref:Uncharacterized protein n=1 Tax=Microthlaspi erraticum TaxID=1685480 RepID=A0A6D2JUI5_9BRAS|nr:unnamed protein product [Microthlaspi erraticum]